MEIGFTPAEEAFRMDVRDVLRRDLPQHLAAKVKGGKRLTKTDHEEWHAVLAQRSWLATHWPVEHGGPGWTVMQRFIFELESALAGAPRVVPFGVNMLGPVLIEYGTPEQRARYLPRILDGSDWWCQGYSEPGAGSDLAGLRTAAVRDGDAYVVNGQKTWTTMAQHANMIFCLVRTDVAAKKQEGISFLLIDMASPGIAVRPIVTLDGEHEVNEVFFTDVRVPVANLVGRENDGWTVAKYLLGCERTNIAGIGGSMAAFSRLQDVASREMSNGRPLCRDPLFAARIARLEIDLDNFRTTNLRVLAAAGNGGPPGAESSMLKIRGTEIRQEIASLTRRALGPYAQPFTPDALDAGYNGEPVGPEGAAPVAAQYFNARKLSIYGGSNEVQRGIVAKALLGL